MTADDRVVLTTRGRLLSKKGDEVKACSAFGAAAALAVQQGKLVVLPSPYRSLMEPLLEYIEQVENERHDDYVTVILPEFVPAKWWQHLLHNQRALLIKGALLFISDLVRRLTVPCTMDFMAVSSYGSSTHSSGVVRILKDLDASIEGRHVLIVEDIVDSGLTLSWIKSNLESRSPASVEICTLLRKPEALQMPVEVKYVGWDIPNEFVVGYGLDYREKYRNLRDIGTLAPHVYS